MLASLAIRDVVLIDRLDLGFAPGLTVLTGETGAGKSILLDALGLALGQRGDAGLVRHGAAQASVTAVFEVPEDHEARRIAAEQGIADDGGALILKRTLSADGRSRAFVNDEPASVGLLRRLGAALVEIEDALVPALIVEELDDGSYTVLVPSAPTPMPDAAKPRQIKHSRPVPETLCSIPSRMSSKAGVDGV